MTETEWLKAKDPEAMLRFVGPRFSARRWQLLACAVVRRGWDLLPPGMVRDAVVAAERQAGTGFHFHPDSLADLEVAEDRASTAARAAERLVVLAADPDSDPSAFRANDARKTNPSAPLFQAACRYAQDAITLAGEAAGQAVEVAASLTVMPPSAGLVDHVRERITAALCVRADASLHAAAALKLKTVGDDMADRANGRNVRLNAASATDYVRREGEFLGYKRNDIAAAKEKLGRKALGKMLHDLVGNPFRPVRFEESWRSDDVVRLARGIDEDRAFDRLPILADALLEADCDEESILRHCRGTEPHDAEPVHVRGCWLIDRILDREPEFFAGIRHAIPTKQATPRRLPTAGFAFQPEPLKVGH